MAVISVLSKVFSFWNLKLVNYFLLPMHIPFYTLLICSINSKLFFSFLFPVLCAKNLVKKDFFRKYLPVTAVGDKPVFAFHTLFGFLSLFCWCMMHAL